MFDKEKEKLKALDEKISRMSQESRKNASSEDKKKGHFDLAIRLLSDLIAGVVVGLGIGMFLDDVFETKPVCMVIFLLIGSVAGFLNVYRTFNAYSKEQEYEDEQKLER